MKRLPLIVLIVAAAAFLAGMLHLFRLRFAAGDVYPGYSSLRADPLGTKALFDSLEPMVAVQRNFSPRLRFESARNTTLLVLGLHPRELRATDEELRDIEAFVGDGGRLVIALAPRYQEERLLWFERPRLSKSTNSPASRADKKSPRPARKAPFSDEEGLEMDWQTPLGERWKFAVKYALAHKDEHGVYSPVVVGRTNDLDLPDRLDWHSAVWFDSPDPAWRVLYQRDKSRAVAMERRLGQGTIVLLSDSYYLSNEALRVDRKADLLAWMIGQGRRVIFDEAHLGVQENPGVATLARKYQLHGFFLALLLLAGLFIWQNSVPFMPPPEDRLAHERGGLVQGRESAAGFVNLLRRNVPLADWLEVAVREWKKSSARSVSPARLREVEAIAATEAALPARERQPVAACRRIAEILSKPSFKS